MAYKDKNKQREANAERQRRYRGSHPITGKRRDKGVTSEGVTDKALPDDFEEEFVEIPISPRCINKPKRGKDIKCFADLPPNVRRTIDRTSESEQEHKRIDPYYPRLFRRIIAAVNKRKSRGGTSEKTPMRPFGERTGEYDTCL